MCIKELNDGSLVSIQNPSGDRIRLGSDPSSSKKPQTIELVFVRESIPQSAYTVVHSHNTTQVGYESNQNRIGLGFKMSVNPLRKMQRRHTLETKDANGRYGNLPKTKENYKLVHPEKAKKRNGFFPKGSFTKVSQRIHRIMVLVLSNQGMFKDQT